MILIQKMLFFKKFIGSKKYYNFDNKSQFYKLSNFVYSINKKELRRKHHHNDKL